MAKNRMTKEDSKAITSAAIQTWSRIGHDAYQLCEEFGETLTEAAAREFIIDADRTPLISKLLDSDKYTYSQIESVLKKVTLV